MNLLSLLLPEIILGLVAAVLFLIGTSDTAGMRRVGGMLAFLALGGVFLLIISPRLADARVARRRVQHRARRRVRALHQTYLRRRRRAARAAALAGQRRRDRQRRHPVRHRSRRILRPAAARHHRHLPRRRRQQPHPTFPRHRAGQHPDLHHGLRLAPPADGAGSGREILLPRRDVGRGHAARLHLSLRRDGHDRHHRHHREIRRRRDRRERDFHRLADAGGHPAAMSGFAFKIAAFPFHFYAGDVYQGAATPVTAILSFVPKTSPASSPSSSCCSWSPAARSSCP